MTTMEGAAGDLDRISALPDNVLHIILGCLGYAPAVSKTAVLSRRWRHVWTRAKSLTFKDTDKFLINKPEFAGFVDWVLVQRGDGADMESLKIQFTGHNQARASPEQVNGWLRYAAQHVIGSVHIDIGYSGQSFVKNKLDGEQQAIVEVPSHGRAASMFLVLPNHRFQLQDAPTALGARHEALTKLELFSLSFSEDGSELTEFVASCCPHLRQLFICSPYGLRRLVLRSDVLQDLAISTASDLLTLDVQTPNLRVFYMLQCFMYRRIYNNCDEYVHGNKLARIVAPKLEEIATMDYFRSKPADLDIHDLTSVRRLTDLRFDMHGKYHRDNNVSFWLFESCPNVEHVGVLLRHMPCANVPVDGLVDLTATEGKAPLGTVRSLGVRASHFPKRHLVGTMSSLLVRCPHLTSLSLDMRFCLIEATRSCFCDGVADRWEICGKVVLESLEEVKITGFGGTEEEIQLLRLILDSSNSIKRMALEHASGLPPDVLDIDTIYDELIKIPCTGRWRLTDRTFTWTCDATSSRKMVYH